MNIKGIITVFFGLVTGGFLVLPLLFLGNLLPEKIKENEITPIFIGILAGSMGMYLIANVATGETWYNCIPSCLTLP